MHGRVWYTSRYELERKAVAAGPLLTLFTAVRSITPLHKGFHMKSFRSVAPVCALLVFGFAGTAAAQTQTVSYEVKPINQMSVSNTAINLVVNTAVAGSAPTPATDAATTWAITTNQTGTKVTGAINTAMPDGVTLSVQLANPTLATSAGPVALGITALDLVTGITKLNESGKVVTYKLSATSLAGVVLAASKTVTFTVVAGA